MKAAINSNQNTKLRLKPKKIKSTSAVGAVQVEEICMKSLLTICNFDHQSNRV